MPSSTDKHGDAEDQPASSDNHYSIRSGSPPPTDQWSTGAFSLSPFVLPPLPSYSQLNGVAPDVTTSVSFTKTTQIRNLLDDPLGIIYPGTHEKRGAVMVKLPRINISIESYKKAIQEWYGLRHENLVKLLGFLKQEENIYIVLKEGENGSLKRYLRLERDANRHALISDIASGIQFLHSQTPAIVHGDIRTDNIFVNEQNRAQLSDFCISKAILQESEPSPPLHESETVRWTAPEVLSSKPKSTASDVFSFAMVISEILSGQPPFSKLEPDQIIGAVCSGTRPPKRPEVSRHGLHYGDLWRIAEESWDTQPENRPNMNAVNMRLADLLAAAEAEQLRRLPELPPYESSSSFPPPPEKRNRRSSSPIQLVGTSSSGATWVPQNVNVPKVTRRKLIVVGDKGSGKTSLLMTYTTGEFPDLYSPTIFDTCVVDLEIDQEKVELTLWDPSQALVEDYSWLHSFVYDDSNVILLCFALDDVDSLNRAKKTWVPLLHQYCPRLPIVLLGCKKDLKIDQLPRASFQSHTSSRHGKHKAVSPSSVDHGKESAHEIGALLYLECSAKTGEGLKDVFLQATKVAIKRTPTEDKIKCVIF